MSSSPVTIIDYITVSTLLSILYYLTRLSIIDFTRYYYIIKLIIIIIYSLVGIVAKYSISITIISLGIRRTLLATFNLLIAISITITITIIGYFIYILL